jgi:ssDNA-specific exonuclease RecJ
LGLIKTSKASYSIKTHKKKELTSSKTYKDLLEKKKTIDWLYQATADQIKRYLEEKHGL